MEKVAPKYLKFKPYFFNALVEGIKTSTIREHCKFEVGEIFSVVNERSMGCDFEITAINRINLNEITTEIAHKEGYLHKDLLINELSLIYGEKSSFTGDLILDFNKLYYQIEFKRIDLE